MPLLAYLLSLLLGIDTSTLGSPDFHERDATYRRLQRIGVWAAPLLRDSLSQPIAVSAKHSSPSPHPLNPMLHQRHSGVEQQYRTQLLLDRIPTFEDWFAESLILSLQSNFPLDPGLEKSILLCGPWLCQWVDRHPGLWHTENSLKWVQARPYFAGSEQNDLFHCLAKAKDEILKRRNPNFYGE